MLNQPYYIKNKDLVIGSFHWADDNTAVLDMDLGCPSHVVGNLSEWLKCRALQPQRENMDRLMKLCGFKPARSVLDKTLGLSLNDCLWVVADINVTWSSVNLFDHEFNGVIAGVALDGKQRGPLTVQYSPEFSTDGVLPKCWVHKYGETWLYKRGTSGARNAGNEPLSEVLASQVLDQLCYPHVKYHMGSLYGNRVSICRLFTNSSIAYLPIHSVAADDSMKTIKAAAREFGFERKLAQQLVFDYLSFNTDRHAGNFGCIVDPDTFEVQDMAPIFDNGMSMMCLWNGTDDMDEYCLDKHKHPALYDTYEEGAKWGKRILGKGHNVERLMGFEFDLSLIGDYSVERVLAIQKWLQRRVYNFLKM